MSNDIIETDRQYNFVELARLPARRVTFYLVGVACPGCFCC